MTEYELIIIGFGKAGKTLAKHASAQGQKVAMIEQSSTMYGGTCINIGCIPSKVLVHDGIAGTNFDNAFSRKKEVVQALNQKNYQLLANDENISVLNYKAQFKSNTEVKLLDENNQLIKTITAPRIIINTGAKANIPKIKGINSAKHLYDSTDLLNISYHPQHLVMIGGGYIALEFASMFANLNTKVTILEHGSKLMPREDRDIVNAIINDLEDKGVTMLTNVNTSEFIDEGDQTIIKTSQGDFEADAILLATGRTPNVDLGLDNTDIQLTNDGSIAVNEHLQTSVDHIYAAGDVKGGLQFTYISLDDYRIIQSHLYGDGNRTTENRGFIPYTMFIDPPLSRVGMTGEQAQSANYNYVEKQLPVNQIPRHKINNDSRGLFKIVINKEDHQILGASLYGKESEEMINLIKLAMDQKIPYQVLRDNIYTHPTMTESFNDLFNI